MEREPGVDRTELFLGDDGSGGQRHSRALDTSSQGSFSASAISRDQGPKFAIGRSLSRIAAGGLHDNIQHDPAIESRILLTGQGGSLSVLL
jgi:hypothetical protein